MSYRRERQTAFLVSSIAHAAVLILILVGLPDIFSRRPPPEPLVLTVDILPISEMTNIKPSEARPTPKPKEEVKKPEAKKPTPRVVTKTAPPPPPPPAPNPAPPKPEQKKEVKKPEEKKEEKKKQPQKEEDLLAVLKAVKEEASKQQADKSNKVKEESSTARTHSEVPYDPNMPLSLSVKDSIKQQLYKCWSVDAGAKNAYKLVVVIEIWVNRDGSLIDSQYTKTTLAKMATSPEYRSAAERALRAIKMCTPLQGLPADKYEAWSYMEFTFDPSEMLY